MNKLDTVTLENGLTIYLYPDLRRHTTLVQFITKFGGFTKDFIYQGVEYHMPDGIAHLLEHYVVECNDEGNFLDILGNRQMNTNASTHFQTTHFYFDAVEDIESVDWLDLGMPEAMWNLKVKDFGPLIVAMDSNGNSLYD